MSIPDGVPWYPFSPYTHAHTHSLTHTHTHTHTHMHMHMHMHMLIYTHERTHARNAGASVQVRACLLRVWTPNTQHVILAARMGVGRAERSRAENRGWRASMALSKVGAQRRYSLEEAEKLSSEKCKVGSVKHSMNLVARRIGLLVR